MNVVEQIRGELDKELKKYKTWEELPKQLINLLAVKDQKSLGELKKGVGQTTILAFLNAGNEYKTWNQSEIQFALANLDAVEDGTLDREYKGGSGIGNCIGAVTSKTGATFRYTELFRLDTCSYANIKGPDVVAEPSGF